MKKIGIALQPFNNKMKLNNELRVFVYNQKVVANPMENLEELNNSFPNYIADITYVSNK